MWKLATWKVGGLNEYEYELIQEFKKAKLDILTISETKKKRPEV